MAMASLRERRVDFAYPATALGYEWPLTRDDTDSSRLEWMLGDWC